MVQGLFLQLLVATLRTYTAAGTERPKTVLSSAVKRVLDHLWASLLEENLYNPRHDFFNGLLPASNALALVPVGASYWDELTSAQERVYPEQATPAEALAAVKARVQAQLEPYCAQLQAIR